MDPQRLELLLDSLQYIESNLDGVVDLDEAAKRACLARFSYQRLFQRSTGMGPGEYFRHRRLSKAALDLANTKFSVDLISAHWGYENLSAFCRAFGQQFGISPVQFRKQADLHIQKSLDPFGEDLLRHWNLGGIYNTPLLIPLEERQLCGISYVNHYDEDIRQRMENLQGNIAHLLKDDQQNPTYWLIHHGNAQTVQMRINFSILAVESTALQYIPKDWIQVQVPAGFYNVFEHRGDSHKLFQHSNRYVWERWWKQNDGQPFDWVMCRMDRGQLNMSDFIRSGAIYLPEMKLRDALLPSSVWIDK